MEVGANIQERESQIASTDATEEILENENSITRCFNFFYDPQKMGYRLIAFVFICLLGFGPSFCYDNPAALEDHIKNDLNLTVSEYVMLYSIYAWPNVILCFIGGFLIDRVFGIRLGTNLYMGITLIGQLAFASGVYINHYWLMIAGRFIFGIGGESLTVAQNNYAVLWFKGKALNMLFGLQLSIGGLGSTTNFLVMEPIYEWVNHKYTGAQCLGIVLFLVTTSCVLSMLCAIFLGALDKRADRIIRGNDETSGNVTSLTDIKDFKAAFWLVTAICVTYFVAIFPFIALAKDFFIKKFKMDDQAANSISSIIYFTSVVGSPLIGLLIDTCGKNLLWIVIAIVATILSHTLLAFTMFNPYIVVIIMGIAYSTLVSSLLPLVSFIIPDYQLGTAYGLSQAIQNLGSAVVSIITGLIVQKWGYTALEIFFISTLGGALLSSLKLWALDKSEKGPLNMTPGERLRYQQNERTEEDREQLLSTERPSANEHHHLNSNFNICNSSHPTLT